MAELVDALKSRVVRIHISIGVHTGSSPVLATNKQIMTKEEIKQWIDKWSNLKPSPQRDMVINIWSKLLK